MAKKIMRVAIHGYSGAAYDGNNVLVGNDTLTAVVADYELLDDGTDLQIPTLNGKLARQIVFVFDANQTLQAQWDGVVAQIEAEEGIT